jgi:hypothetical protein
VTVAFGTRSRIHSRKLDRYAATARPLPRNRAGNHAPDHRLAAARLTLLRMPSFLIFRRLS